MKEYIGRSAKVLSFFCNSNTCYYTPMNRTNFTMSTLVRMPYTNNWRVGDIHRDCFACTVPASSGQKGIEIR